MAFHHQQARDTIVGASSIECVLRRTCRSRPEPASPVLFGLRLVGIEFIMRCRNANPNASAQVQRRATSCPVIHECRQVCGFDLFQHPPRPQTHASLNLVTESPRFPESTGWAVERTIESLKRRGYNSLFVRCRRCCSSKGKKLEAETLHRHRWNTLGITRPGREPHGRSSL